MISGVFYGDELSGAIGLSYDDFDRVTTRFRQLLGEDLIVTLPSPLFPTPLVLLLSHTAAASDSVPPACLRST